MSKEQLKLYNKEKLIDIIEKMSIEYAIKNQQYEYLRHNDYSNELQERIDKAIEYIKNENIVVGTDIEGNLYSSKDILIDILKGKAKD